jgi:hypothetical protein
MFESSINLLEVMVSNFSVTLDVRNAKFEVFYVNHGVWHFRQIGMILRHEQVEDVIHEHESLAENSKEFAASTIPRDQPVWPSRPFIRKFPHSHYQQKCLARTNVCCIVTTDTGRRVES